jgi:hypothetical protein
MTAEQNPFHLGHGGPSSPASTTRMSPPTSWAPSATWRPSTRPAAHREVRRLLLWRHAARAPQRQPPRRPLLLRPGRPRRLGTYVMLVDLLLTRSNDQVRALIVP